MSSEALQNLPQALSVAGLVSGQPLPQGLQRRVGGLARGGEVLGGPLLLPGEGGGEYAACWYSGGELVCARINIESGEG